MPVDYQQGKIYRVINDVNATIYIGCTAQKHLSYRMGGHRQKALDPLRTSQLYVAMRIIGADHFRIVLVHNFPCNTKDELVAEEIRVMNQTIKAGTYVYNSIIGGKMSAEACAKQSADRKGKHTGEQSSSFNFGSISLTTDSKSKIQAWAFHSGKQKPSIRKAFSCNKYGFWQAKLLAEAERKKAYPKWKSTEETAIDAVMAIEWD